MTPQMRWKKLLEQIVQGTESASIEWKATSDEDVFQTSISSAIVQLLYLPRGGRNRAPVYVVKIMNSRGQVVDSFSDEDLSAEWADCYIAMQNLMALIRRRLSGADIFLDDLIQELEDLTKTKE